MEKEKRRFSRIFFDVPGELIVANKSYAVEQLINLSVGGCLIEVVAKFLVGESCKLKIPLGSEEIIILVGGEIVRAGSSEVSVKFTSIDPGSLYHLQNIIKYNSADPDVIEEELDDHPGLL